MTESINENNLTEAGEFLEIPENSSIYDHSRGTKSKIKSSPKYAEIYQAYQEEKYKPKFNAYQFHKKVVAKIDPSIHLSNVLYWIKNMKEDEKAVWDSRVKKIASTALDTNATISNIRDAAIKVFYLKVTEFLRNPEMLEAMSFPQAMQLYKNIEGLNLATERLKLEQHDQNRKDVFTIFSMGLLSGQYGGQDVENLLGKPKIIDADSEGLKINDGTSGENIPT